MEQCLKKCNAFFKLIKNLVISWWTIEISNSPNHKDVMQRQIGVKTFDTLLTKISSLLLNPIILYMSCLFG
jgi:hypothetical protein